MPPNNKNNNNNKDNTNINSNHKMTQKMEGRLRLRKNNDKSQLKQPGLLKDSSSEKENTEDDETAIDDDKNITQTKRNCCKRAGSPNVDDSLADFKLPKLISKPHPLNNKIKFLNDKPTSSSSSSLRSGKKRPAKRRKSVDTTEKNQPSIESSFFKPPTAFVCPLCLKSFNDINAQSIHSKNCATKNNVSTKKLLAAAELQERQAEERLAIGLPAAPFQQAKRKTFNTKKMASEGDPDIQLAIALSKSLSEMEAQEHFDEALALAAESNEKLLQMTSSQRKSTLQNFGFVTNKPAVVQINEKPRRRKHFGSTVLQTRTQETRERLLSEKIGEILIGNEPLTQLQLTDEKIIDKNIIDMISLRSDLLKQIHKPNSQLWSQSFSTKPRSEYYVEDLCKFISPIDESETKLNDDKEEMIVEKLPINEEIVDELNDVQNESKEEILESERNQSAEIAEIENENNSVASSWRKMVNSNKFSDVIIHVKNSNFIYCHEIVLWTRCQSIQNDLIINDENLHNEQRKKIQWLDINFSSAMTFLEFIYCGEINNLEALENDENLLHEVHQLAEKYKVVELLKYLEEKLAIVQKKGDDKLISEDREMNSIAEIGCDQCNEERNSITTLELSMNRSELNPQMLERVDESIPDNREKDFTTEIDTGHSNEEVNLPNSQEWSINQSEFNPQILGKENESTVDDREEDSTTEVDIHHYNEEINSPHSLELPIKRTELIAQQLVKSLNQSSIKSPNVSCQLHYSRISVSPDMFEDMEMSYNSPINTGRKSNISETHENGDEEALNALVELVNESSSSKTSEKDETDDYSDIKLTATPKRYPRLSSTCPETSTTTSMASNIKKNSGNLRLSSSIVGAKSNMSLFIEKIQKNNAKGILDSDSESEMTIPDLKKYRRNPFKIRNTDEDSSLTGKYNSRDSKNENKSLMNSFDGEKKKSALSLFEDEIRARVAKSPDKFVTSQDKNGDSIDIELIDDEDEEESDVSSKVEIDEENVSIYTKYKRTHRENSIGNYRSILKSFMQKNIEENDSKDDKEDHNPEEKIQISSDDSENENENIEKNTPNKQEISTINKRRLAELSAFDIYEAMSPSPLNSSLDDSTKSKSSSLPESPIDLTELSDDENPRKLSPNKSTCDNKTSHNVENTMNEESDKANSFEYRNNDGLEFGNWSEEMSEVNDWQPLTQSNFGYKNPDKNLQVSPAKQNNLSQLSLNSFESIDLTQSDNEDNPKMHTQKLTMSDTITENITRILKDCGVLDSTLLEKTSQSVINIEDSRPIVLSSGSETESVSGDTNDNRNNMSSNVKNVNFDEFPIESDLENNFMQFVIEGGADTPHSTPYLNDFQQPSTSKLCINDKNVTARLKKSIKSTYNSLQRNIHSISSDSDDELPKISGNSLSLKRSRCTSVSPQKNQSSTRLLTIKSRSEGNFTPNERRSMNNREKFITPTKQLLSYLDLSSDKCEISFDVSPRENYSAMSSPELNIRLTKYGLRNQKRHRAIKLLNYVYDQLHPLVPEYLLTSHHEKDLSVIIDRDIELNNERKDKTPSESDGESSDDSFTNSAEIADEMMNLTSEDEEYDEKDVILVRECFQKLLDTDRLLHNKVLKYEPIPLETIHEKLKERGIKCGLQLLADYLDDECISFYIECPKKRQRQNKKPKKKRKE